MHRVDNIREKIINLYINCLSIVPFAGRDSTGGYYCIPIAPLTNVVPQPPTHGTNLFARLIIRSASMPTSMASSATLLTTYLLVCPAELACSKQTDSPHSTRQRISPLPLSSSSWKIVHCSLTLRTTCHA